MPRRKVEEWYWQVGTDFSRLGGELSNARPSLATGKFWEPRVDVIDLGNRIVLRAELAGVRSEDVDLLYNPDRHAILIRGVRVDDTEGEGHAGFYQLEVPYGEFAREILLPKIPIKTGGIRAQYRNGFLLVEIPKADHVVVRTSITIEDI